MSEYLIQQETLTGLADAIREKTGETGELTPEAMIAAIAGLGGGLPEAIAAVDGGTFKPTSDIKTNYYLQHSLGVQPDFFILIAADASFSPAPSYNFMVDRILLKRVTKNGSTICEGSGYMLAYSASSGYPSTGTGHYENMSDHMDGAQIRVPGSSSPLSSEHNYVWVCGKFSIHIN